MSWSIGSIDGIENLDDAKVQYMTEASTEVQEQIDAAKKAARALVESGAVGDEPVVITLGGHANPGHKKSPSYANDMINVSVSQKYDR